MTDDRRHAASSEAGWDIPHQFRYAGLGVLLGLGSPVGAFLLRWWRASPRLLSLWAQMELKYNAVFYGYMGAGSVLAFAAFGYYVGLQVEGHRVSNRHLRRRLEELHLRSVTDGLTGAFSHAYLQEVLALELDRAKGERRPLSVLMLDLDDFKKLNDGKGHLFGDRVLKELTETASMNIRHEDVLGRYGGEEFLVIMPGADAGVARTVAERVRRSFERAGYTTVSIGASTFDGEAGTDATALIARADAKLYEAKRSGKNKVAA